MKKAQMNISHYRFVLFNLKIFDEIVTTNKKLEIPEMLKQKFQVKMKTNP